MEKLIEQLMQLKFSRTEAAVYITLIKNGRVSGYKAAKLLGLARSTVYSALDSLYKRGCVYLIPGDTNEYEPKSPEILIDELKEEFIQTADELKEKLIHVDEENAEKHFFNIQGYENIISKAKELLSQAEKEVYINTDFELTEFHKEFQALKQRGVRVIVFTFTSQETSDIPLELYSASSVGFIDKATRLMLVVDFEKTLLAGKEEMNSYIGTFTDNRLLSRVVSEHIHHDIYLLKLKNKFEQDIISEDIFIDTLAEKQGGFIKEG